MSLVQVAGPPPAQAAIAAPLLPNQLDLANVPSRPSVFASVSGMGYLLTDPAVDENAVRSYDPTRTSLPNRATKASVGDWDGDDRDEMLLLDASGRLYLLDDASTGFATLAETSGVTAAAFADSHSGFQSEEIFVARGASLTRYPEQASLLASGAQISEVFDAVSEQGTMTLADGDRGVSKVTDLRAVTDMDSAENRTTEVVATYLTADRRGARMRILNVSFAGQGVTMAAVDGSGFADAAGLAHEVVQASPTGLPAGSYDVSISAVGDDLGQTLSKRAIWRQEVRYAGLSQEVVWREVSSQSLECDGDDQASLASAVLPAGSTAHLVVACPMRLRVGEGLDVRLSFSVSDMEQTSVAFKATSIERPAVALVAQTYGAPDKAAGFQDELDVVGVAVAVDGGSRQVRGGALSWALPNPDSAAIVDLDSVKSRKDNFNFGAAETTSELPFAFTSQSNGRITIKAERVSDGCPVRSSKREACEFHTMKPRPIALLQAPPIVEGLEQEFVPPTFVTGTSSSETRQRSISYTMKSSLGLTIEVPSVVEAGVTATIEAQIGESEAATNSVSISDTYFGRYDDNTVIFTLDSLWTARYRITEASDGIGIGNVQHVLIPRASIVMQTGQRDFQSRWPEVTDGAAAWNNALTGIAGDPGSYPSLSGTTNDLANCAHHNRSPLHGGPAVGQLHTVQMGTKGAEASSVRIGTDEEHTQSFDLSVGVEAALEVGGVAQSLGFSRAAGTSFTVSGGTEVGVDAYVGHIAHTEDQLGKYEGYNWRLYFCRTSVGGWPVWAAGFHTSQYNGRGGYFEPTVSPGGPAHYADVTTTPTLSWTATGTVDRHRVEVQGVEDPYVRSFEQSLEPSEVETNRDSSPGSFQQAIPSADRLTSGTSYRWRVTAFGLTGGQSISEWQYFKAWNAPTAAPTVYDPAVNPDGSLTIEWAPPADAKGWVYDVSVENSAGAPVASFVGVHDTRVRTGPLQQGQSYLVRVNGRNPVGTGPAGEKTVDVQCGLNLPALPGLGCVVSDLLSPLLTPS